MDRGVNKTNEAAEQQESQQYRAEENVILKGGSDDTNQKTEINAENREYRSRRDRGKIKDITRAGSDNSASKTRTTSSSHIGSLEKKLRKRREASPESSSNSSTTDHSSSSESDRERKRRHKKKKEHKKQKKEEGKKRHRESRKKLEFGAHGVLFETDIYTKEQEFIAWLIDVKGLHFEELPQFETKKYFRTFIEDYNTCTLPHEKYYDIEKWTSKEAKKKKKVKKDVIPGDEMELLWLSDKKHLNKPSASAGSENTYSMSRMQLEELNRVQQERVKAEKLRKMGVRPKENMGIRYEKKYF
ncbi:hypothetical protein AX774_g3760 [Zancudomyces culisetae]|uniref:Uncharacterized protein n=1 Tax=Zancudomyces culisetae TaxID=1213189 RepID=A0A1R1PP72_ZANCU|nr:hypothetical protein AX774_g3760 [Zancudomyces culisetae]|eukprot:OMH82759.1 hypothetical protein AX774_g3760 [Zancudomyces culisetae]